MWLLLHFLTGMPGVQTKLTRKRLEWFKYSLYCAVPLVFGYGLGRIPDFWERVGEVVRAPGTIKLNFWNPQSYVWHRAHQDVCVVQFPSAATNPKGPYLPKDLTQHRPSLQSEFQNLTLEVALDTAIAEARAKKQRAQEQEQPGGSSANSQH